MLLVTYRAGIDSVGFQTMQLKFQSALPPISSYLDQFGLFHRLDWPKRSCFQAIVAVILWIVLFVGQRISWHASTYSCWKLQLQYLGRILADHHSGVSMSSDFSLWDTVAKPSSLCSSSNLISQLSRAYYGRPSQVCLNSCIKLYNLKHGGSAQRKLKVDSFQN